MLGLLCAPLLTTATTAGGPAGPPGAMKFMSMYGSNEFNRTNSSDTSEAEIQVGFHLSPRLARATLSCRFANWTCRRPKKSPPAPPQVVVVGYDRSIGQACQSSAAGEHLNTPGARVKVYYPMHNFAQFVRKREQQWRPAVCWLMWAASATTRAMWGGIHA